MAQLSDDCFAFGGPMMSVDEAVGIIAARVTPVRQIESIALAHADGRILAHDIAAPLPLPPFTNSAVDGYAVSGRDLPQAEEQAFLGRGPGSGRQRRAGSGQGRAGDAYLYGRADAGCRRYRIHAGRRPRRRRQGYSPGGAEAGGQCAARGRGHSPGDGGAESRPAAAAAGCRACRGLRPDAARRHPATPRSGVLHRQRTGLAG